MGLSQHKYLKSSAEITHLARETVPRAFSRTISDVLCIFRRFHNFHFSPECEIAIPRTWCQGGEFVLECENYIWRTGIYVKASMYKVTNIWSEYTNSINTITDGVYTKGIKPQYIMLVHKRPIYYSVWREYTKGLYITVYDVYTKGRYITVYDVSTQRADILHCVMEYTKYISNTTFWKIHNITYSSDFPRSRVHIG